MGHGLLADAPWVGEAADAGSRAHRRGETAGDRAAQLRLRSDRLASGEPVTADDVIAGQAAVDRAGQRERLARDSAARAHLRAAQAHDQAARVHLQAAEADSGDSEEHRRRAVDHARAADADRVAGQRDLNSRDPDDRPARTTGVTPESR